MVLLEFRTLIFQEEFDLLHNNLQNTTLNEIETIIIKAELLENKNELDNALQTIDKAISICSTNSDEYLMMISLIQKVSILLQIELGKKRALDKNFDQIINLFKDIERKIVKSNSEIQEKMKYWSRRLYNLYGIVYWEKESQLMSNNYLQKSLDLANELIDDLSIFVVLHNIVVLNYHHITIMPSEAIDKELEELGNHLKVASYISAQLKPSNKLLNFYNNAEQFYLINKNLKLSGEMNEKGAEIAKEMGVKWPIIDQSGKSNFIYRMFLW